ncbi:hypothetical protein QYE76_010091 [Lolium multiflorum]|uniref:F-box domain-containing protein n=1 Tax=Lolium multiflorum TaxID=4521 RepID=A0AAD8TSC5_LOLMU|nr:hypothetical protein QYE76_009677 [Lolium multiflorum]KAK1693394.1 hypothetical protein QYE76_010091 [Lolium multiflorum]
MAPGGRRRRPKKALALHISVFNTMSFPCGRDWAELPKDVLLHILHKLEDQAELLLGGAAGVCRSWRHAARGEPELWRHIDMRGQSVPGSSPAVSLKKIAQAALRLSAGQCESFAAEDDVNDDLLLFLADQAPLLKSLRLISCYGVSNEAFVEAIEKFPLIEELELSSCVCINDTGLLKLVAKACPLIKHLKYYMIDEAGYSSDNEDLAITGMLNLCSLELYSEAVRNEGLSTILDNCPGLEYLNIHGCPINMDDNLRTKCARINVGDYEHFPRNKPIRFEN